MTPKYNFAKKSDIKRLERDLNNQMKRNITTAVKNATYKIQCVCGRIYSGRVGRNHCPSCGRVFEITTK